MTIVKICGLQTVEHAVVAAEAGADMLGFIFAPSRRLVAPAQVAAIASQVRRSGRAPMLVGVFANAAAEEIAAVLQECDLDAIQLSGDEEVTIAAQLPEKMLLKAVRLAGDPAEAAWLEGAAAAHLLIDAHVAGSYGGAGVLADWNRAAELARRQPVLLAGGLAPSNVAEAIRQVRPWGVDVSSGVESDGVKDSAKIRAFVAAVRAVDQEMIGR